MSGKESSASCSHSPGEQEVGLTSHQDMIFLPLIDSQNASLQAQVTQASCFHILLPIFTATKREQLPSDCKHESGVLECHHHQKHSASTCCLLSTLGSVKDAKCPGGTGGEGLRRIQASKSMCAEIHFSTPIKRHCINEGP